MMSFTWHDADMKAAWEGAVAAERDVTPEHAMKERQRLIRWAEERQES